MNKFFIKKSLSYNKKMGQVIPGGVHYSFKMPWESQQIHFVEGKGTRITDLDNNEYLDFFARFGANILGHNHPLYNEALKKALDKISSCCLTDIEYETAELICECVPCAEMVRFSLSGTEAVQNALRLARAYTGRNRFVRFSGHYHGNADNIMGGRVGNLNFPVPERFSGDFYDTEGMAKDVLESQSFLIPWNNILLLKELLENNYREIAALIMEPICINGGGIMPVQNYLKEVRDLCNKYGVVLIFDEMITGFRVGLGGAQKLFNITPDITTLGKAMAGGALPVSAIVGKKEIMQLYEKRKVAHGGTFNGYSLGLAAVNSTMKILMKENGVYYLNMEECMSEITAIFLQVANSFNIPLTIETPNSCAVFKLKDSEMNFNGNTIILQYINKFIAQAMCEYGILVSNMNRFYGNISITRKDINLFEERINYAFKDVSLYLSKFS